MIEKRKNLKKAKEFEKADEVRTKLAELNIQIMDTANGTLWEKV